MSVFDQGALQSTEHTRYTYSSSYLPKQWSSALLYRNIELQSFYQASDFSYKRDYEGHPFIQFVIIISLYLELCDAQLSSNELIICVGVTVM